MYCSWAAAVSIGFTLLWGCAHAAQIPLRPAEPGNLRDHWQKLEWPLPWDLNRAPSVNATDNLMFDNAFSLLQRWPNTRWRNGHIIIPATMAPGTLLYHGRSNPTIPTTPEWIATDPEHSYLFCRNDCWLLTLAAMRELRFLYFDGSSAAKGTYGTMDSQDLLAFGRVNKDRERGGDKDRILDLCKWGKPYGIDGYVRMEMDFEIMLCSFTEGVKTVSMLNLQRADFWTNGTSDSFDGMRSSLFDPVQGKDADPEPPERDPPERGPPGQGPGGPGPGRRDPTSSRARIGFEVINAGSWHNDNPGETRFNVDYAGLLSFYDTNAFPSLVEARSGKERIQHRIGNVAPEETKDLRQRITDIITREEKGSGVDWKALAGVIVDRYAERLEFLSYILDPDQFSTNDTYTRINHAKTQLIIMLTPYFVVEAVPPSNARRSTDTAWAMPIFQRCATTHTALIADLAQAFTPEERVLLSAVQGTTHEICRRLVRMWVDAVTIDDLAGDENALSTLTDKWGGEVSGLMTWLNWSVWAKCKPRCGFEEICYLDTWPALPADSDTWWNTEPKPRCARRMEPYSGMRSEDM